MTKNEDLKSLLPCPFCPDGGKPSLANDVPDSEVGGQPDSWLVYCQKCGCSFEHEDTIIDAIEKWNTRPTVTPADEKLRAAIKLISSWAEINKKHNGFVFYNEIMTIIEAAENKATTDGDAERALAVLNTIECRASGDDEIISESAYEVLIYGHEFDTIRTALQSTRKPSVDTINIKREVLQGVREALLFYARHEHWMAFDDTDPMRRVLTAMKNSKAGNQDGWEQAEDALASLDAVLEGE